MNDSDDIKRPVVTNQMVDEFLREYNASDLDGREMVRAALQRALNTGDVVPLATLSAALDEIFMLRRALAWVSVQCQNVSRFKMGKLPAGRLAAMSARVEMAAAGQVESAFADVEPSTLTTAMRAAGIEDGLTRFQWENERP